MIRPSRLAVLLASAGLAACNLAPAYHVPAPIPAGEPLPASFKAAPGWVPATPADAIAKGQWWALWNDPVLDGLERRVEITNQNVAAARAAYAQARALVAQQRAALFPTISGNGAATRTGTFGPGAVIASSTTSTGTSATSGTTTTGSGTATTAFGRNTSYSLQIGASWEPDLFGRLTNTVRQARGQAEATAADLANATLAARGELAVDYFQLRGQDAQAALLEETIVAYTRALTIARNKYAAGVVSRADVETAQTQLSNAQVQHSDVLRSRAVLEDAIGVLVGANPSTFTLAAMPWTPATPDIPGVLPSAILQRRPDIAAAERQVAAANAGIGIQRAGYFPSLSLSGSVGADAGTIGDLFTAAASVWSLGANVVQTLFDFGATRAPRARRPRRLRPGRRQLPPDRAHRLPAGRR